MLQEFKKFILKGNVVDLAIGVVIGVSFCVVVNGFAAGLFWSDVHNSITASSCTKFLVLNNGSGRR